MSSTVRRFQKTNMSSYPFFEGGEFNFHVAQNYTSEVLFAGTNIGGAKFETDVSEFRFGDPRGYFSTTEDLETAYDTDDELSRCVAKRQSSKPRESSHVQRSDRVWVQ